MTIEELIEKINKLPTDSRGHRAFSKRLRAQIATESSRAGISIREFAAALNLAPSQISKWRMDHGVAPERPKRKNSATNGSHHAATATNEIIGLPTSSRRPRTKAAATQARLVPVSFRCPHCNGIVTLDGEA